MKHKIITQNKNPLLHREEMLIEFESESAPSFDDIKKTINKDNELTIVKRVDGNFGQHKFTADVLVYESKEAKDRVETIPKKIRAKMAEEEKKRLEEEKAKKEAEKKAAEEAKKAEEEKTEEKQPEQPAEESKEQNIEEKTE